MKWERIYTLTVIDYFSKWSEAYPLTHHKAPMVANVLEKQLFSWLGMPYQLLSNHGPEFGSEVLLEKCKWMGIGNIGTKLYHQLIIVCLNAINGHWNHCWEKSSKRTCETTTHRSSLSWGRIHLQFMTPQDIRPTSWPSAGRSESH